MRSVRALRALAVLFALLSAAPAHAEWQLVPLVGLTYNAHTNAQGVADTIAPLGTHINFGGAVSLLGGGILGAEGIGVFTPNFKGDVVPGTVDSSRALAVMGNVVLTTPRRWTEYTLRPYVSGGFGVMRLSVASGALGNQLNAAGFDIGGGAVGFFTKRTGVRFDFRYYRRLHPGSSAVFGFDDSQLSFMTLSVGVVIRR
jgi:hypothetical protein